MLTRPVLTLGLLLVTLGPAATAAAGGQAKVLPIEDEQIVLPAPIHFKTTSPRIDPASFTVLDSVAATLETHMDIAQVEIGVHTDSRGSGAYNKKVSQARADAVLTYLKGKGLPRARLTAVGYGEERPIDTNRTAAGRARNRRVELVVKKRCPAGLVFKDGTCKAR